MKKVKKHLPFRKIKAVIKDVKKIQDITDGMDALDKDYILPEKMLLIRNRLIRTIEINKEL